MDFLSRVVPTTVFYLILLVLVLPSFHRSIPFQACLFYAMGLAFVTVFFNDMPRPTRGYGEYDQSG